MTLYDFKNYQFLCPFVLLILMIFFVTFNLEKDISFYRILG